MNPVVMLFKFVVDDVVKSHKDDVCKKKYLIAVMCKVHCISVGIVTRINMSLLCVFRFLRSFVERYANVILRPA